MVPMPDTLEHGETGNQELLLTTLEVTLPLEMYQKLQVLKDLLEAESVDIAVIALLEAYTDQTIAIAQQADGDDTAEMSDQVAIADALMAHKDLETEAETTAASLLNIYQLVEENNRMMKALTSGVIS